MMLLFLIGIIDLKEQESQSPDSTGKVGQSRGQEDGSTLRCLRFDGILSLARCANRITQNLSLKYSFGGQHCGAVGKTATCGAESHVGTSSSPRCSISY